MHDVEDVEAFVRKHIQNGRTRLSAHDLEEMVAEGLRIMSTLYRNYQPGKNGLNPATSKFSGYATTYLHKKLQDSYHRLRNARLVANGDGKRAWRYDPQPESLDAITDGERDAADRIRNLQTEDAQPLGTADVLRTVLNERWEHDREITIEVAGLIAHEYSVAEAAERLKISEREAQLALERMSIVKYQIRKALLR